MPSPLVSIFLCNYNHARYLKQCFAGLQAQTYTNIEIVITDDGSTDGSQDIIRDYAARDSRFKQNYFQINKGVKEAFHEAAGRTRGDYLYGAASDDFIVNKDFFLKAVTALENDQRPAGFYGITGAFMAETEKLTGAMGTAAVEGYNTPLACFSGFLKCRHVITSPSCLWRRALFMKSGGEDFRSTIEKLGPRTDFFMNHAMGAQHGMIYEKTLFACQRMYHAKTNYSASLDLWKDAASYAEVEKQLRAITPPEYPEVEKDWLFWRAFWLNEAIVNSGHLK